MFRLILICILLLKTTSSFSEIIDGPANLRTSPSGTVAISLNDKVSVSILDRTGNWFKIKFMAFVDQEIYSGGVNLKGGVILYDVNGQEIGQSVSSFNNFEQFKVGPKYGLVVTLYTHKNNIVPSSIIEDEIVRLINCDSSNKDSLLKLKYLEAKILPSIEGYNSYIVFEPKTDPMGQAIRLIMFFENSCFVAFAGNPKFENQEFSFISKTQILSQNLIVYYLDKNITAKKQNFEASLHTIFNSMD